MYQAKRRTMFNENLVIVQSYFKFPRMYVYCDYHGIKSTLGKFVKKIKEKCFTLVYRYSFADVSCVLTGPSDCKT